MNQTISEPADADYTTIAKQVLYVRKLATDHLGRAMTGDATDLEVLQAILDKGVLSKSETFALQSLGAVLGMRLCDAIDGLEWAIVEDEYGRDPAIRYKTSSLLIFPLTMISKRVEKGEVVDIRDLVEQTRGSVQRLKNQVDWPA